VAVINESFAKHFFEGRNPIGMHLVADEKYKAERAYEIVGIVKDVHYFGLREALEPMIYFAVWRPGARSRSICIRTNRDSTHFWLLRIKEKANLIAASQLGGIPCRQQPSSNLFTSVIILWTPGDLRQNPASSKTKMSIGIMRKRRSDRCSFSSARRFRGLIFAGSQRVSVIRRN
jgi:hypothetical protein